MNIKLNEAVTHLPDLIKAAVNGEDIFIIADDQQIVQLVPIPNSKRTRKPGSAKGQIIMSADFDDPLDDFKEYIE
jgi:antitoxin (DNA-binding transcriptional repressor) of toxin-antitoxin stability system